MARFLARAFDLPAATGRLASPMTTTQTTKGDDQPRRQAGITAGLLADAVLPTGMVTRGADASFLARAGLPRATADFFNDDNDSAHEGAINRSRRPASPTGCAAKPILPATAT